MLLLGRVAPRSDSKEGERQKLAGLIDGYAKAWRARTKGLGPQVVSLIPEVGGRGPACSMTPSAPLQPAYVQGSLLLGQG